MHADISTENYYLAAWPIASTPRPTLANLTTRSVQSIDATNERISVELSAMDARFSHLAKPVGIVVVHKSPQRAKSDVVVALEVAVRSEWVVLVLGNNSEVCNRVGLLRKVAVEWVSGCMEMASKSNGEARCGTS